MSAQIYLIAPEPEDAAALPGLVRTALAAAPVAALLLPRRSLSAEAYASRVAALRPLTQGADVALLIEGEPDLVRSLGADGLHVTGTERDLRAALSALKPDFIVGSAFDGTRHDAMTRGELGADYIIFGPLSGAIDPEQQDLAQWWAETMEIPSVLSDPAADPASLEDLSCEFVALGESVWVAPDPAAALKALAAALERAS
ncbi:thiamine phosphate synthase [Arsenicitalea aurantiaca]|uniref:Thiamine phosphate synthase n=1 Tax=Arsenicitalea aurantiaca TaxID=1783274 RepID=A0A433XKM4_9HYPH|nr:thiamine phosphate synthase [Arsenicitalea aurantiaca]RUT34640.1 thiamine phosphate synthase [Arsenicitalea aurantiaca]